MPFVYLMCDSAQNLYKIGVTRSKTSKRLKQLQTGNGNELFIIAQYETDMPFLIEKYLHNHFSDKQENGEWYALEHDDVISFNMLCEEYVKNVSSLKDNPFFMKKKH